MSRTVFLLVLIVIAVASMMITYVWVMTLKEEETKHNLVKEEVRFYGSETGVNDRAEITLRNMGDEDVKITVMYWSDSSFERMIELKRGTDYELDPDSGVVGSLSTIKVVIIWGVGATGGGWASGATYYFRVVTEAGSTLEFTAEAP